MFPEAKPREASTVEGPQNILLSRGILLVFFYLKFLAVRGSVNLLFTGELKVMSTA